MQNKTLSVIMPNYNYGHWIEEALNAIFSQSYSPLEVIVVDDCSTDNSVEIIEQFIKEHPNLRILKNERNMGVMFSVNRGIQAASGDYVFLTASDDKVLPGFLENSMALLSSYPEAGLCCADNLIYDRNRYSEVRLHLSDKPRYFSPEEAVDLISQESFTPILPQAAILRKQAFLEAGGYLPELKWSCDSFTHHVMVFRYGFCYIPEVYAMARQHEHQFGRGSSQKSNLEREVIKNMMDIVKTPKYSDVLPYFKRAGAFSTSPFDVLAVIIANKEHHDFFTLRLLRFAVFDLVVRRWVLRYFPAPVVLLGRKISNIVRYFKGKIREK